MPSQDFKRSDRIADLIKVEISQVLSQEVRDPRVQGITGFECTSNVRHEESRYSYFTN